MKFQKEPIGFNERKMRPDGVMGCFREDCPRVHKEIDPNNRSDVAAAQETAKYMKDIAAHRKNNRAKNHVLPGLGKGPDRVFGEPGKADSWGFVQQPPSSSSQR